MTDASPPGQAGNSSRGITAAIASTAVAGLGIGMTFPLLPLTLDGWGASNAQIGINACASSAAMLVIAPLMGRLNRIFGLASLLVAGNLLFAVALITMPHFPTLGAWFLLRFFAGVGLALQWIAAETWVNTAAQEDRRARVLAIYVMAFAVGVAGGPLIQELTGIEGVRPFAVAAALCFAAAIPPYLARAHAPRLPPPERRAFLTAVGRTPDLIAMALLIGLSLGAVFGLFPIYGIERGLSPEAAVRLTFVFLAGGTVLQLPLGWVADKTGRRPVLRLVALTCFACAGLIELSAANGVAIWFVAFLWGGMAFGLYTLSLAVLGARFVAVGLAAANAAFVMTFETGSLIGAPAGGLAMEGLGAAGLPLWIGTGTGGVLALALFGRSVRRSPAVSVPEARPRRSSGNGRV